MATSVCAATFIVSCNIHELGHAAVGTAFGWDVDRICLCLPSGGEVRYEQSLARGDTVESWSGGLGAALMILAVYGLLIARRSGPLRRPVTWSAGLGLLVPLGPQAVIAALEGTAGADDYAQTINRTPILWVSVLLVAAVTGPAIHLWIWRSVLHRPRVT